MGLGPGLYLLGRGLVEGVQGLALALNEVGFGHGSDPGNGWLSTDSGNGLNGFGARPSAQSVPKIR